MMKTGVLLRGFAVLLFGLLLSGLFPGPVMAASVPGRLALAPAVDLGLIESGVIVDIAVQAGQLVDKGDRLLALDSTDFKARLSAARARVAGLKPRLAEARREWDRAQELYERTVSSNHALEQARIDWQDREAQMRVARAEQRLAELALKRSVLKAPFRGLVVDIRAYTDQPVRNQLNIQPLLRLIPLDRAQVILPQSSGSELPAAGEAVHLEWRGKTRKGLVSLVAGPSENALLRRVVNVVLPLQDTRDVGSQVQVTW